MISVQVSSHPQFQFVLAWFHRDRQTLRYGGAALPVANARVAAADKAEL
jgi:hypothetical protein